MNGIGATFEVFHINDTLATGVDGALSDSFTITSICGGYASFIARADVCSIFFVITFIHVGIEFSNYLSGVHAKLGVVVVAQTTLIELTFGVVVALTMLGICHIVGGFLCISKIIGAVNIALIEILSEAGVWEVASATKLASLGKTTIFSGNTTKASIGWSGGTVNHAVNATKDGTAHT